MSARRLRPRPAPLALAAAMAAAGCTVGPAGPTTATFEDTRVAVGECLFGRTEGEVALGAALLAAVLPALISEGVSLVGGFLKAAGETRAVPSPPRFANFVARADAAPSCVQVIRGRFHALRGDLPVAYAPDWLAGMQMDAVAATRLVSRLRIYPAARPDFLFEGTFARAGGTDAYTIIPRYVALNAPMERPVLGFDDSRVVSLALDIFGPNLAAGSPIASAAIPMGRLRAGEPLCLEPIGGAARSGAFCRSAAETTPPAATAPPADSAAPGGFGSLGVGRAATAGGPTPAAPVAPTRAGRPSLPWEGPSRPFEATWFTLPLGPQDAAYSVRAVVSETRSGSEAAAFLSRAFEASKAGITTALTTAAEEALLRERRDAAVARRAQASETAGAAFDAQLASALGKLQACTAAAEGAPRLLAAREARRAQDTLNRLADAQGSAAVRFGTLVPMLGGAATADLCRQAIAEVAGAAPAP